MNISPKKISNGIAAALVFCVMLLTADAAFAACRTTAECQRQIDSARSRRYRNTILSGTYSAKVSNLTSSISKLEGELASTDKSLKQTKREITSLNAEIKYRKSLVANLIKKIDTQDKISGVEALVASNNFVEFVNTNNDLRYVQKHIGTLLTEVKELKVDAVKKRNSLNALLKKQKAQRADLGERRGTQSYLLSLTRSEISRLTRHLSVLQKRQAYLIAQQQLGKSHYGGTGGYPWWNEKPFVSYESDPWGEYKRQCVSYAAWRWAVDGHPIKWRGGNANQWPARARAHGYSVNGSSPKRGDIAIYMGGYYGHAMIVESVGASTVTVSQYNAEWKGLYSISTWSKNSLTFIHKR